MSSHATPISFRLSKSLFVTPYSCCSILYLLQVALLHFPSILLHLFVFKIIYKGVMIPCYAHYITIQILHCACTLGSSLCDFLEHLVDLLIISFSIGFSDPLVGCFFVEVFFNLISSFGSTISLVQVPWFVLVLCNLALLVCFRWLWGSEDSIFVHSSIVHKHWGASPFLSRTLLLDLFDCLSPCGEMFREIYFYLQSLDPQYSLISSNYSSLDMCIWFHSIFEKCTLCGGTLIILTF